MANLLRDLSELVAKQLRELAWRLGYPINRAVGLDAYFQAFTGAGFVDVSLDRDKAAATFTTSHPASEGVSLIQAEMTFEEIMQGWSSGEIPIATPRRFYDSMFEVYDRMGKNAGFRDELWYKRRNSEPRAILKLFEAALLEAFRKHHEHVLLGVSADCKDCRPLESPRLIHEVIKMAPFEELYDGDEYAEGWNKLGLTEYNPDDENLPSRAKILMGARLGPTEETLLEILREGEWRSELNPREYYPSDSTITGLFLGMYYHALAKEKGYTTSYPEDSMKQLVAGGFSAFKTGRELWAKKS